MQQMKDTLQGLFPEVQVCGDWVPPPTRNRPCAKCTKVRAPKRAFCRGSIDTMEQATAGLSKIASSPPVYAVYPSV